MSDNKSSDFYDVAHQAVADLISTILGDVGAELYHQHGISQDESQQLFHRLLDSYGISDLRIRKRAITARKKKTTQSADNDAREKLVEWVKMPVSGWESDDFVYTKDIVLDTGYPVWCVSVNAVVAIFDGATALPLSSGDAIVAMRKGVTINTSYIQ